MPGTVVRVESARLHAATAQGVVVAARTDATDYREGDAVVVVNGQVAGRVATSVEPVYVV